jgi:hypothetical protein
MQLRLSVRFIGSTEPTEVDELFRSLLRDGRWSDALDFSYHCVKETAPEGALALRAAFKTPADVLVIDGHSGPWSRAWFAQHWLDAALPVTGLQIHGIVWAGCRGASDSIRTTLNKSLVTAGVEAPLLASTEKTFAAHGEPLCESLLDALSAHGASTLPISGVLVEKSFKEALSRVRRESQLPSGTGGWTDWAVIRLGV